MLKLSFILILFSSNIFAAGGFEKPVLWSARAAQHGGAYASAVAGPEALMFNPASLATGKKEIYTGISAASGATKAPLIDDTEKSTWSGPVTPVAVMYSQNISDKEAFGVGVYSIGGLDVGFDDVSLRAKGPEFDSWRPDIFGRLSVLELGLGYSREVSQNLKIGGTFRSHYVSGSFAQLQVSEAKGLGGMGIPDGTVLAISRAEFKDLEGFSPGTYTLGIDYKNDDKTGGLSLVYRSPLAMTLKTKGKGQLVYSATGAAAAGANAGEIYSLKGSQTEVTGFIPEAWTLSGFRKITKNNTFHAEYTWTEYSRNSQLGMNGSLTNPVDGTTTSINDVPLNWHDMHDFKTGWTNTSIENWILGGGYSITLPVTDRKTTGPTFASPGNYHHFYAGAGKLFSTFRVDAAFEYYVGSGKGKTKEISGANQVSPSVSGNYKTRAQAFFVSMNYFL